jgi:hypothetical protein
MKINKSRKDTHAHTIIYYNVKGIEFMKAKTKICISLVNVVSQQNKNASKNIHSFCEHIE